MTPTRTRPAAAAPQPLRAEEVLAARRRARDRSLVRDGAVLVLVIVGLAVAWSLRLVPNEAYPAAREVTAQLDAAFGAIRAGELELGTEPEAIGDTVRGVRSMRPGGEQRWVLTGASLDGCYAVWWDEAGTRRPRTVPSTLACEPSATLTTPHAATFDRIARAFDEDDPTDVWATILPDPWRFRTWFLPVLIVGGWFGLSALVRMSIALLTGNRPSATRR